MLKKTITAEVTARDIVVTDIETAALKKKAELAKIKKESKDDKKIEPKPSN